MNTGDASIIREKIADDYQGDDPTHVHQGCHRHRASSGRLTAVECMISGCKSKWSKQIELWPKQSRLAESNQRGGKKPAPTSSTVTAKPHCTMCTLVSFFSSRSSALRHILKFSTRQTIQHIFVPTRSVEGNIEKIRFLWASNSKFWVFQAFFKKICVPKMTFPVLEI